MEKLSMCRVCLGEDIRLVPIVGTHLQEMYESLVLLPFETEDGRSILVCYICCAKLKNCYDLRKSCLRSEEWFTQMLSCNESEQTNVPGIYNIKRFYVKNVIHFSVGCVQGTYADSARVEALKCEVKDEPNVGEVIREDGLEENSISDSVLPAYSDIKNEENMGHVLEMDADSVGVGTLFVASDVKDEQSDPGDVDEDVLEESSVSDDVPSADSHDDFVTTVKVEQIGHWTSDPPLKEPIHDVQINSEDTTSSNLNEHNVVQDTFKKLREVTAANIKDDNKEITASVQYTCAACQHCYGSKCELQKHVSLCYNVWKKDLSCENTTSAHTHKAEKPHQCNVCNKRFSRIHHLTRHRIAHNNEVSYQDHACKEQFPQKDHLFGHMRTHTGEKPHHCEICKKQFLVKGNLTTHMRTHTGEKPYHCDICKKKFSQKHHLIDHIRAHNGERPHHCKICKKQFSQKGHLTTHMRTHSGEKPYRCNKCKKQFAEKKSLTIHMRTHTGEKPFHCNMCKKQFSQKGHLIGHMRTHTGEKPHHCNICKKQFSRKYHLIEHIRTHAGKKPHCDICNKQFSQKRNLTTHMRTHSGEKPHHCDICKRQFSLKHNLTRHMRQHAGEKPHHCDIPKKQFSLKCNLTTHAFAHW